MATPATTETFADVSKAVCEKVDEACRDILRHMKDIGADATERTSEFTKLQAELLATCEKSVTSWSKTADDLRGKISSGQEEISQLVKAMQEPTPSTVTELSNAPEKPSLRQQWSTVGDALLKLRKDRLARFNRIEGLINEAKAMYERTGVPSKSQFEQIGEDFSQARIADCEKEVAALKLEVSNRTDKAAVRIGTLSMLHSELVLKETDASEAYPRVAQEDITSLDAVILAKDQARVGITDAALAAMDTRIDELTDLRNKRSVALDSLRQACITLWCKLDISSSHQQEFLLASQGVSRRTMAKYFNEINRLHELRKQRIPSLIAKMRAEILSIWNQLFFGPVQRQEQFPVFSSTDTSEETLRAHEIYLESLQALIPVYRPILDKEEQRQGWQSRVINLAKSTHDADFFKQKNVHKILAEEEKVRDIGKKQLPELEKEMEALLAQWEQANKSPFLYNGTKLIEIIKADQEKRKALLPAKKGEATPNTNAAKVASRPSTAKATPAKKIGIRNENENVSTPKPASTPVPAKTLHVAHSNSNGSSDFPIKTQPVETNETASLKTRSPLQPVNRPIAEPDMSNALAESIEKHISAAAEACSRDDFKKALDEYTKAISETCTKGIQNEADRNSLVFLYEKRSIIYTRLGMYEQAVEDDRQTQTIHAAADLTSLSATLKV